MDKALLRALIVALAPLIFVGASIGAAGADETEEARRAFQSGNNHFDLTEYKEALEDFKTAYRHRDDPAFLYNIAQCYRFLNNNEEAIRFYRNYLRRVPSAPNRGEVEEKISALEAAAAATERARSTPHTDVMSPPETKTVELPPAAADTTPTDHPSDGAGPTPIYKKWWLWTAVGVVAAAGLGLGLGLGLSQGSASPIFPSVTF